MLQGARGRGRLPPYFRRCVPGGQAAAAGEGWRLPLAALWREYRLRDNFLYAGTAAGEARRALAGAATLARSPVLAAAWPNAGA